jgi:hypothetical protein
MAVVNMKLLELEVLKKYRKAKNSICLEGRRGDGRMCEK